jgi:hypothetical protein
VVQREKFFKTEKAMNQFQEKLMNNSSFHQILAHCYPEGISYED